MDLNPLSPSQMSLVVIAATVVIFLATYAGLRRFFVLPYLAVMQERRQQLDQADLTVDKGEALLSTARETAEQEHAAALARVDAILAEAREQSAEDRRARVDQATSEASELLERGRADIEAARSNAVATLRTQAIDCVGIACRQLIGSSDDRTVSEAVDKLMARHVH